MLAYITGTVDQELLSRNEYHYQDHQIRPRRLTDAARLSLVHKKAGICTRSRVDCDLRRFLRTTGHPALVASRMIPPTGHALPLGRLFLHYRNDDFYASDQPRLHLISCKDCNPDYPTGSVRLGKAEYVPT
jgi:hypothetical protein